VPSEALGRRYSAALFALAKESGSVEGTVREIDAFAAALAKDRELSEFFDSPVIDRTEKNEILARALAGRASELTAGFIALLVRKRRETLLPIVARQMHELADADAGRAIGTIATPTPLDPAQLAELARRLSNVYQRTIVPQQTVDPSLLGGAVVQVGDRYFDASVAGKLEAVRRHLLATSDGPTAASPNGKGT
jgi:F-type H+-transporting ATPase subunit delta